jgi:hypothetical protein
MRYLIGCALLAAAGLAHAQAAKGFDCSKAKDPKACEERVAKLKAAHAKAQKACEGKQGDERRECMRREACAQAKDPAQCEARLKDAAAKRQKLHEACKDKKGEEYRACIRQQRGKT